MNYIGISHSQKNRTNFGELNGHDSGLGCVNDNGDILFAHHSERFSKIKNDNDLHRDLKDVIKKTDKVIFYEKTHFKYGEDNVMALPKVDYIAHHESHAAAGFYTRPWQSSHDTVILTIDGYGDGLSSCIYDNKFNIISTIKFPRSIGILYAVVTDLLGYKTLSEEYIVMGLSCYGKPVLLDEFLKFWESLDSYPNMVKLSPASFKTMREEIKSWVKKYKVSDEDLAASIQKFAEIKILSQATEARKYGSKLVYSGGVAQNIMANSLIRPLFDEVWIPPATTDAGSALGAAAFLYCKDNNKDRINFTHAYLGYDIDKDINVKEVVDYIIENKVCGVANGRAEWGPRALGNRSLLGDVRYDIKDTVNKIKKRELFRPFAPAILEEYADEYFEGPYNEYMQYSSKVKEKCKQYPSIIHVDCTARVQIVKKDCKSVLRQILEEYHKRTGVPMLLNTSLNIKGQPILNDEKDCKEWENKYGVKIFGYE